MQKDGSTRVFIPLHALRAGSFKIKFFSAGETTIEWFVADAASPAKTLTSSSKELTRVTVEMGKPAIVVRDSFAPGISTAGSKIERPKKTIISNSNEFELQIFEKFYRVFEASTGELVLERAGTSPNFSPASRFLGAFAEGAGFEVIDLYADTVIFTSGALNRSGDYEGTAHVAAWSRNDTLLALSFWGYGGVYLQQALIDGKGVGNGSPSCHACQGIGIALQVNFENGMVVWSGQSKGWASLYEPDLSSDKAVAEARKAIPENEQDNTVFERQQALEQRLSSQHLKDLARLYQFDSVALLGKLPANPDVTSYDGKFWRLGDELRLSHACTRDASGNCSSSGKGDDSGDAALRGLLRHTVTHTGLKRAGESTVQVADARLNAARAAAAGSLPAVESRTIWRRLKQLGVQVNEEERLDVSVESIGWEAAFDKPDVIVNKLAAKIPAIRDIMPVQEDSLEIPDYIDEEHEIKKINPKRVRGLANWQTNGQEYWLVAEDYQTGNSSTPTQQYIHIVSGNASGLSSIVDLSTRLGSDGTLAKSTDQENLIAHPWPTDFDTVTISSGRYLLASGHWLHDRERWALVFDLQREKALFFNGDLASGATVQSLALTANNKILIVSHSDGRLYFYDVQSGKQVLTANDVDDELIIYDPRGYYASTYEGAQFVFLKFPGLSGYLSFKQFSKILARPDVIAAILNGESAETEPKLSPPPRLAFTIQPEAIPGKVLLRVNASSQHSMQKLRLFLDGQPWREYEAGGQTFGIEESLLIPAQARWLTAVMSDSGGVESIPLSRELPRDARPSDRTLYAFAVGTDAYQNLRQSLQLHFAVSDAHKFIDAVQAQKGSGYYGSIKAFPFLNELGLKRDLPAKLREIARSAGSNDTVMLFVSGHGYRSDNGKLYLILKETSIYNVEETALSWDDLAGAFDGAKARIVIFIDACHSGAIPDGGSNDEIADTFVAQKIRFTVIAAAKGRQESFESVNWGGGLFTSAIVSGITKKRGSLDTNNNGVVELSELYSWLKPLVLAENGGLQTPWLARSDMVGEVPLF